MDGLLETCTNCNNFGNLEIIEIVIGTSEPTEYKCQCPECLYIDIYQEDLDDFYQAMNDLAPPYENKGE